MTRSTSIRAGSGRGWAYIGALLGGAVSIAANVAHSYVPPPDAPASWTPHGGAVVGAVFWPVALFVAVEIFARVAWPDGRRWTALRFLGLLPVAAVAAVVSYRHLSGLLAFYREDGLTAVIGPLAVDGLMVMATGALIATGTRRAVAVPATVAERVATEPVATEQVVGEPGVTESVVAEAFGPIPEAPVQPSPEPAADKPATNEAAPPAVTPPAVTARVKAARKTATKRQPSAAERVAKAAARTPNATPAQIAARLKLSERTVQRHMAKLAVPADDSVTTPVLKIA